METFGSEKLKQIINFFDKRVLFCFGRRGSFKHGGQHVRAVK